MNRISDAAPVSAVARQLLKRQRAMETIEMKAKPLSAADSHALACFFAMHHGANALSTRPPGERNIERTVMATFGLVTKKGPFKLTPRGKRAIALAQSD